MGQGKPRKEYLERRKKEEIEEGKQKTLDDEFASQRQGVKE